MSCQRETNFERKDELYKYLFNEQQIDLSQKGKLQLVVLQVGNCGACTREVLNLVERKIPHFSDSTYVLMARRDSSIEANLATFSKVKILTDNSNMMPKYGLRYVTDYIFLFEAGELKKTYRLDEYGLKNAERQLKG